MDTVEIYPMNEPMADFWERELEKEKYDATLANHYKQLVKQIMPAPGYRAFEITVTNEFESDVRELPVVGWAVWRYVQKRPDMDPLKIGHDGGDMIDLFYWDDTWACPVERNPSFSTQQVVVAPGKTVTDDFWEEDIEEITKDVTLMKEVHKTDEFKAWKKQRFAHLG